MSTHRVDEYATEQDWLAEEQRIRMQIEQGGGQAGVADWKDIKNLSGLQVMQQMLLGKLPFPSMAQTLSFALISVAEGEAVFQGTPHTGILNPMGTVHGGWYGTLLDSAMGCAVQTMMPAGRGYTTAEYSVHLVRAVKLGQVYRVIGRVLHCGKQLATAEAKLVDVAGKMYAHSTTSCLVFDLATLIR